MTTDPDSALSPFQREGLSKSLRAMQANRIGLRQEETRLFPANLSLAVFVHLIADPISGSLRLLGLRTVDEAGETVDRAIWTIDGPEEMTSVWQDFSARFLAVWQKSIHDGKGPCLIYFGRRIGSRLRDWGESFGLGNRLSFLWQAQGPFHLDLRRLLADHFDLPIPGRLTLYAMSSILGLLSPKEAGDMEFPRLRPPESPWHDDPGPIVPPDGWGENSGLRTEAVLFVEEFLGLAIKIWQWARGHLVSSFTQSEWEEVGCEEGTGISFLRFLNEEKRAREEDIRTLQQYSLPERIERFRALGPLTFLGTSLDNEGRFLHSFRLPPGTPSSKFREEDFLRLVPIGSSEGLPVILARYCPEEDQLAVRPRQGRLILSKNLTYSLEEELTDFNHAKLVEVVNAVFTPERKHPLKGLLAGNWSVERTGDSLGWLRQWLATFGPVSTLNPSQRTALALPFRKRLALIEGPPGTGKSFLLGWIIIALILEAQQAGRPLRLAVSALTHRAIDNVLRKVAELVTRHRIDNFPARLLKWGRWQEEGPTGPEQAGTPAGFGVVAFEDRGEIELSRHLVLGATGYGLYHLFGGGKGDFPAIFDWVVFDEASQILVPQALLSLVYGKGSYLFLGDVKQLPPIVMGRHGNRGQGRTAPLTLSGWGNPSLADGPTLSRSEACQSILAHLLERYDNDHRVRLDMTYRLNQELCDFPSRMWYEGTLHPAPGNARARLDLSPPSRSFPREGEGEHDLPRILDPERPVTLVLADHRGCHQQSELEATIVARLAYCLLVRHEFSPDRLAIISPHRAQNNAIARQLRGLLGERELPLPVIDTVERLQGSERDVIIFSLTTSDPDQVLGEFINDPNRFNVAITRARQKLIVVGSHAFFLAIPQNDKTLTANRCFKEFFQFCRSQGSLFVWERDGSSTP